MTIPSQEPSSSSSSSSSSALVYLALILLPLLLVSASVILLDPSPSFWFSLPSSPSEGKVPRRSIPRDHSQSLSSNQSFGPQPQAADAYPPTEEGIGHGHGDFKQKGVEVEEEGVKSISEPPKKGVISRIDRLEAGLARARLAIREASLSGNRTSPLWDPHYVPSGPAYRNAHVFHRSYLEMENTFKIFVYPEGDPPLFHDGPCHLIYSTEGRFIHDMDLGNPFLAQDPDEAHMFFLPFSVTRMVHTLYTDKVKLEPVKYAILDYVTAISRKYHYWNTSLGADHFMLSCHDWAPLVSEVVPHLYNTSIRVLCNANTSEGFNPAKDATLPEINRKSRDLKVALGGRPASGRTILGFFAGGIYGPHGKIRPILFEQWHSKDKDILVYEYLPKNMSYEDIMRSSKFCLCPSGYEVASPRVVEAIYAECVPVIISETYVLPFSEVLDWDKFSVTVEVKDIPRLKSILMGISMRKYLKLSEGVKQVQRHFMVYSPPKRYDMFHMIIHSIWLRRLNVRVQDPPKTHITIP